MGVVDIIGRGASTSMQKGVKSPALNPRPIQWFSDWLELGTRNLLEKSRIHNAFSAARGHLNAID